MADVRPFVCVRPNESIVDKVAALPYDVYNRKEAAQEVKREPQSFLAIDRAETQTTPLPYRIPAVNTYQPIHQTVSLPCL